MNSTSDTATLIHLASDPRSFAADRTATIRVCGERLFGGMLTTDPRAVTCQSCMRRIAA